MLYPLADKLIHFGNTHVIEEIIVQLKKELLKIVEESNKEHALDIIKA